MSHNFTLLTTRKKKIMKKNRSILYFFALAERRVMCKRTNKDPKINDINYEFNANSPNENCDEDVPEHIFPTSTLGGSLVDYTDETLHVVGTNILKDFDVISSTRRPRSENSDEIIPTSILKFDPQHPTNTDVAENRQNNPNADIQDIITGIVKLLNGNVNVHANTQYSPPPPPTRRYATRINNRGPPRISELPIILPGIDDKFSNIPQKTTPFPNGMRKPPTVPYPFDLPPPEKPLRNEHPMLHNKPLPPTNRPPWHGSRTRPPIQITNTNRLQIPSRVSHLPLQPSQELRPPTKTVNPMSAYNTRIPDINKMPEIYANEKPVTNLMEQIVTKPEQTSRETTRKQEKKTTKMPPTTSPPPIFESTTKEVPELPEMPELPVSYQAPISPPLPTLEQSTEALSPAPSPAPFSHAPQPKPQSIPSITMEENMKTPELTQSSIVKAPETSVEIKTTEPIQTSVKSTISPSRVQKPSQSIESTDFKSFYARPGIVLDDTDYTPGAPGALEPSTQPTFHHIHRNTGAQSSATLSNIYAEIFDVTLSAIQGQPQHNKVVDLIEYGNTDPTDIIQTKLYGNDGNDIIVSASDDNSFVSIDGKRTYINLFGETAETEHLKKPIKTQNDQRVYASKTVN